MDVLIMLVVETFLVVMASLHCTSGHFSEFLVRLAWWHLTPLWLAWVLSCAVASSLLPRRRAAR